MRSFDLGQLPTLFTTELAGESGMSRHHLSGARSRSEVATVGPGVYAVSSPWSDLSSQERHRRLCWVAGAREPDAVVSHVSAALAWELPNPRGEVPAVWLTVTGLPRVNRAQSWVHLHRAAIPQRHRRELDGLRLTSPARTVVDCMRSLRPGDALAIADAAVRRGLTGLMEIEDVMDVQHRGPHLGRAHAVLPLLDPRRENWLESFSAARLHANGIPLATPQVEIRDLDGRFIGRVDALWEETGVVGEADGAGKYLGDFDEHDDRSASAVARRVMDAGTRESRLRDLGLGVVRWDPGEIVHRPHEVAQRLRVAESRQEPRRVRALIRRDGESHPTLYTPGRM
jgi:hypothetical protein